MDDISTPNKGSKDSFAKIALADATINAYDDASKLLLLSIEEGLRRVKARRAASVRLNEGGELDTDSEDLLMFIEDGDRWCLRIKERKVTNAGSARFFVRPISEASQNARLAAARQAHKLIQQVELAMEAAAQNAEASFRELADVAADVSDATVELSVKKPVVSIALGRAPARASGRAS